MMRPAPSDTFDVSPRHSASQLARFMQRRAGVESPQDQPAPQPHLPISPPVTPSRTDFVLYFHPKCPICTKLLGKLDSTPLDNVFLQNVMMLTDPPQWINGVPLLADTRLGLVYRGTDCMVFLDKMMIMPATTPAPPSAPTTPVMPHEPEETLPLTPKPSFSELFSIEDTSSPGSDRSPSKFSGTTLSDMMKLRSGNRAVEL